MTLKKFPPIKELLAALPPGTLTDDDTRCLQAISACLAALRAPLPDAHVFSIEARGVLLSRLKQSVAETLEPHAPQAAPRGRGRPAAPLKAEIAGFKDAITFFALTADMNWHSLPPSGRGLAEPRAALDKTYAALLAAANKLGVDTDALGDMRTRLVYLLDAYATQEFGEKPGPMMKSTTVSQMHLVLKTLQREAIG